MTKESSSRSKGNPRALDRARSRSATKPRPLSRIDSIRITRLPAAGHEGFEIRESPRARRRRVPISPDAATCADCIADILDPSNRRHRYPFTNCTHCGPRLTIVQDIPYDRSRTTMSYFALCDGCRDGIRGSAEPPLSCAAERMRRLWSSTQPRRCVACRCRRGDPIAEVRRLLGQGNVVAIKGLGGYHLACDASNEIAVRTPAGAEGAGGETVCLHGRSTCRKSSAIAMSARRSASLLESRERPIVLLQRRDGLRAPRRDRARGRPTSGSCFPTHRSTTCSSGRRLARMPALPCS